MATRPAEELENLSRSDVLKVAGENVSVVEVEAVLSAHPSVLEAAVVGQPDALRDEVPVGYVFDVITRGYGAMADYSAQVPVHDRWAIVTYVRALQKSQRPTPDDIKKLPEEEQQRLKAAQEKAE